MSQNTLVIADGTGSEVLGYLNDAFDTVATLNSGSAAPAETYAFMWWADTSAGLLKIRNAANTAWVTVGTLASTNLGLIPTTAIGSSVQAYDADTAKTDTVQAFTAAQRGTPVSLSSSAGSIASDFALGNNFTHTFTENTTLANPTNLVSGQAGMIVFTQHSSSPKTLAFGSYWKFPSAAIPAVTATNSAVDVLVYYVESSTRISAKLLSNLS